MDVVAILFVLWVFAFSLAKVKMPTQPPPIFGERWGYTSYSDFTILMAGKRFHEEGFLPNRLLPNVTVGYKELSRGWPQYQVLQVSPANAIYDVRIGPLPAIVNGLLRYAGINELLTFYKLAVLSSVVALAFWYFLASLLFGRTVALLSLFYIGTSPVFSRLEEGIGGYAYGFFLAFGGALAFLLTQKVLRKQPWTGLAHASAWLFTFLLTLTSPGFLVWLLIFFIGYQWVRHGNPLKAWTTLLSLSSAPAAGLLIHSALVAWALGGIENMLQAMPTVLGRVPGEFYFDPFLGRWSSLDLLRLDLVGVSLLLVGTLGVLLWLGSKFSVQEKSELWAQFWLLLVFLLGGTILTRVVSESNVPLPEVSLRLLLPFLGLLVGFSLSMAARCIIGEGRWQPKALAAVILLVSWIPMVVLEPPAQVLDVRLQSQPRPYYGRSTDELRALAQYLEENTNYGDIVFTEIETGDPGYARRNDTTYPTSSVWTPVYPHPAYEYLSGRRIEVARDAETLARTLAGLEGIRRQLTFDNPASKVRFFVLTDDHGFSDPYGAFASCAGELKAEFSSEDWWVAKKGVFPSLTERKIRFLLYLLDPEKTSQCI